SSDLTLDGRAGLDEKIAVEAPLDLANVPVRADVFEPEDLAHRGDDAGERRRTVELQSTERTAERACVLAVVRRKLVRSTPTRGSAHYPIDTSRAAWTASPAQRCVQSRATRRRRLSTPALSILEQQVGHVLLDPCARSSRGSRRCPCSRRRGPACAGPRACARCRLRHRAPSPDRAARLLPPVFVEGPRAFVLRPASHPAHGRERTRSSEDDATRFGLLRSESGPDRVPVPARPITGELHRLDLEPGSVQNDLGGFETWRMDVYAGPEARALGLRLLPELVGFSVR